MGSDEPESQQAMSEHAQVRVRVPIPSGEWREVWLPVDLGDALPTPLFEIRTQVGREAIDLEYWLEHGEDEDEEEAAAAPRKVRYPGDVHADVEDSAETIAARINELHLAIWAIEACGCDPLLTEAVNKLGERMRELREKAPQYIHYDNY